MTRMQWAVEELLPHSKPMILIDEVVDWGEGWATAAVRIAEDTLFFERGRGVPTWAGIEYMAQTVAMYVGICAKQAGQPIKIGLLLGTRRYEAMSPYFTLGSRPLVHVREEWQDERMAAFDCHIEDNERLAEATLNLYRPDDPTALLKGSAQ